MRVFETAGSWWAKVNFVDENNVLVGYDISSQCCENYGWFFSTEIELTIDPKKEQSPDEASLLNYRFEASFFEAESIPDTHGEGGVVIFKLVNINNPEDVLYLHLYNVHNGYYSHGFSMSVGGTAVQESCI